VGLTRAQTNRIGYLGQARFRFGDPEGFEAFAFVEWDTGPRTAMGLWPFGGSLAAAWIWVQVGHPHSASLSFGIAAAIGGTVGGTLYTKIRQPPALLGVAESRLVCFRVPVRRYQPAPRRALFDVPAESARFVKDGPAVRLVIPDQTTGVPRIDQKIVPLPGWEPDLDDVLRVFVTAGGTVR
jgi:hypothetical protein